jgi:hypothetical protein
MKVLKVPANVLTQMHLHPDPGNGSIPTHPLQDPGNESTLMNPLPGRGKGLIPMNPLPDPGKGLTQMKVPLGKIELILMRAQKEIINLTIRMKLRPEKILPIN